MCAVLTINMLIYSVPCQLSVVNDVEHVVGMSRMVKEGQLLREFCNVFTESLYNFTHRQTCEFLVVSVDSSKDLLAVSLQLLQLLFDYSCVQRFTLLNQSLSLPEHQLDLPRVQIDLLLERLSKHTHRRGQSAGGLHLTITLIIFWVIN